MPSTIVVNCPDCDKEMKVPAELEGKKIRCKGCGETFVVKAPRKAAAKPAKKKAEEPKAVQAKKAPAKPAAAGHDEEEGSNPYGVTDEDLAPRCPHCAQEMESSEAVICLHCGYNTITRVRIEPVKTVEHTPADWILWLLPGIVCVIFFFLMIGNIAFLLIWLNPIIEENKDAWWNFGPRAMQLWGSVFSLAVMFFTARFAIKRLIFHPRPPEKIKRK